MIQDSIKYLEDRAYNVSESEDGPIVMVERGHLKIVLLHLEKLQMVIDNARTALGKEKEGE